MTLIAKAKQFAHDAHDSIGQKRKVTGKPYWTHTDNVARIVSWFTNDETTIAAANVHDVLEDVKSGHFTIIDIVQQLSNPVGMLVNELTDVYTKEDFPGLNRARRKNLERARLITISPEAKLIKLADILDNTSDIVWNDPNFAVTYLAEIENTLAVFNPLITGKARWLYRAAVVQVKLGKFYLTLRKIFGKLLP